MSIYTVVIKETAYYREVVEAANVTEAVAKSERGIVEDFELDHVIERDLEIMGITREI